MTTKNDTRVAVDLRGVTVTYGAGVAVDDISLTVGRGEFLGLLGPSGSGKTTLIGVMLGLIRLSKGTVTVLGSNGSGRLFRSNRGASVAYVPQLETIDWSFPVTAAEVAMMGIAGRSRPVPWSRARERRAMFDVFERTGIGGLEQRHIRDLSGGQRQRVFLARALLAKPELLLLDEATAGTDIATRAEILEMLRELNREGMTIVMATHDLNSVAAKLPRLACINKRLIAHGDCSDVFTSDVLTRAFGAPTVVLDHHGSPMAAELPDADHPHHVHVHDDHASDEIAS